MTLNILEYHKSITKEIEILKDRVSHLISHNLTQGEWKEAILRAVLRRHLPETISVGRGFIVTRERKSTQVDILVLKPGKPILFQDGDLFIVTPDVPGAIIEVKSEIHGPQQWYEVSRKLAENGRICYNVGQNRTWLGIFSYHGNELQIKHVLDAVCQAYTNMGVIINCVTIGNDYFVRYWGEGEREIGDSEDESSRPRFRAYELRELSPSYFVGNLVDAMCNIDRWETGYTWFAYERGKRAGGRLIAEKVIENGNCVPH